ncbi:MMS19 nucleotide excision repair protein [Podospora fimiseda]|uniref:MMS19 nucleotide excision repair protein n=1 Tax=Podospora fimiseda TaxID=252190 RepID=A0AAN7BW49_9PEZI|nr:MMS19 nucleotide excision repair protein [Podospora fimiseda]
MAQFKQWALQYVLSDDESAQVEIAQKAAKEIESTRASSTVVGNWAASIHQWMTLANANDEDDEMKDGDEGTSGDIISRAKALSFLAATLEFLDRTMLRPDQVLRLIGFFGSMFSYDHKAGITASAKALRRLYAMKSFKPDMGIKIIEDVCKIKEDFRLQTAATRLEIYELFLNLVQDPAVSSEFQHKYGSSCGFAVDLLELCKNERDPRNLMIWFRILATLLKDYSPSSEVTEEIFKTFSAYFPITLRASATPIGITAEDLKEALRGCFSAHQRLAALSFPFLMQKLDQGDAVTVAVKVDILKTIKACIEQYENPQNSVVPHIEKIWGSLKYEVRNGEVKETIDATLEVLRAIARKLDGSNTQKLDVSLLQGYIDIVFRDCRDDLSNPTYTKQAGLLLMTVTTTNIRGYVLYNANFIDIIRQNLRQPKSPSHIRDLLLLLNSVLKTRLDLVKNRKEGHPDDEEQLKTESRVHLETLFHDVYLPIWTGKASEAGSEEKDVLKQVVQGLALLVSQEVLTPSGDVSLLYPGSICSEICSLLTVTITKGLSLSSNDNQANDSALEDEVVVGLRSIVMNYTDGYDELVSRAKTEIAKRDWTSPSEYSLGALRDILSRLTFIGCSEIPTYTNIDAQSRKEFSPLQHFVAALHTLLELFPLSQSPTTSNVYVISSIHAAVIWFRNACEARYKEDTLAPYSTSDKNWLEEFETLPGDWLSKLHNGGISTDVALGVLQEDNPEVYRQFLRLSLFTVRQLYTSATATTQTVWSEKSLTQLAQTAALVIGSLDEKLQKSCNLAHEAFNFFRTPGSSATSDDPINSLLTVGILQGLRPGALTELYKPGGVAEQFLCNTSDSAYPSSRAGDIRAAIGTILSNKYKGGPSTSDPESLTMKRVLDFWGSWLKDSTTSAEVNADKFQTLNNVAMHIIAGAVARQDKSVTDLIPILHQAAASQHANGETVAHSLGILVKANDLLTPESHAVVRRFYKQWAYSHLVKPLYELARPTSDNSLAAARYSVIILPIVSHCPFTVYQDDLEPLVRLLVTALTSRGNVSEETAQAQVISALEILVEIILNDADALKGYVKEIVSGTTKVYQESVPKKTLAQPVPQATLTTSRKLALQVLGAMPKTFEERYTLPYAPPTQRMLVMACGDPARKVREAARSARANWAKVA